MSRAPLLVAVAAWWAAQEKPDPAYAATVAKRAADAVAAAKVGDPAKAARAQKAVEAHYLGLNAIHGERDAAVKAAGPDKEAVQLARRKAEAAVKVLHEQFLADLVAELTPPQMEAVKDKMTYNVLPNTYKTYGEILPDLTAAQKAKILELLKAGREEALVAGSSNEKHEKFRVAKGRITNYLSGQGYDLKKATDEWAARRKAADAARPKK